MPEVFLSKYSQTAIDHAAHFRRVVNVKAILIAEKWFLKLYTIFLALFTWFLYPTEMIRIGRLLNMALTAVGTVVPSVIHHSLIE